MGLFNKIKNVLFEEEEVEEEIKETPSEIESSKDNLFKKVEVEEDDYRPLPKRERNLNQKNLLLKKLNQMI